MVTDSGDVLSAGSTKYGQCGRLPDGARAAALATFSRINLPDSASPIVSASCGWNHSVLLDSLGRVYTFGRNSHGQLGRAISNPDELPSTSVSLSASPSRSMPMAPTSSVATAVCQEIDLAGRAIAISCGSEHAAAIVLKPDHRRCLVTWGWNEHGSLFELQYRYHVFH